MMPTIQHYINEHEQLMQEWIIRRKAKDGVVSFAKDGIVEPKVWFQLPQNEERILFLLKEAYDIDENRIWDQTKWIKKNAKDPCTSSCHRKCEECGATGYTFNPIAEWVYGIRQIERNKNCEYDNWIGLSGKDKASKFKEERDNLLKRIAIINLKKSAGANESDDDDLYYYTAADKDLLLRQIELICPTLIVCGNTYNMLRCLYPELERLEDSADGCSQTKKFKVVATCHPSKPSSGRIKYENVMKNYIKLKKA